MPIDSDVGVAGAIALVFALSLLHAALPNHWLPFVLVSRALGWSRRRTFAVLALAGGGHVVATSVLGLIVWWLGSAALDRLDPEHVERYAGKIAGAPLVLLGIVYLVRHAFGKHGHTHAAGGLIYGHEHAGHESGEHDAHHSHEGVDAAGLAHRGAIATLFLALTFSPCGAVVVAFFTGVRFGFGYVLVLAVTASLATVAAMTVLTWLTLAGFEKLRFPWLDRNEMRLTGLLLVAIGLVAMFVPT